MKSPHTILITGARGAIGGALAERYAAPGNTLILQGRDAQRLSILEQLCAAKGARVLTQMLDVRDIAVLSAWLTDISQREVIDLVIVNAGVNTHTGADGALEPWAEVEALVQINVLAAMATVHAVLPAMRARGHGQIALISSLAAYYGLAHTPSYSASKAALKAYGEGLRGWLVLHGIEVNVVMPGYVASPMCHDMPGPKPFLWSPERAARTIQRGLARNQPRISFPFPLNFGTWGLSLLRPGIAQWILQRLNYGS